MTVAAHRKMQEAFTKSEFQKGNRGQTKFYLILIVILSDTTGGLNG
jgi:hypothetical protein